MLRRLQSSGVRFFSSELILPGKSIEGTKSKKDDESLKRFIVDKIRSTGPITVAEYMKTAVSAPTVGYYGGQREVFGNSGDFITAPELTQLFGEMLGVWCYYELASTGHNDEDLMNILRSSNRDMLSIDNKQKEYNWEKVGEPTSLGDWQLVECGPGSGQLMNDLLMSLDKFQETNVSVHLVEMSDVMIERQEKLLCVDNASPPKGDVAYVKKNKTRTGVPIFWYKNVDDIPEKFSVFVANEFMDALPIHQFVRDEKGWHEVYVNITEQNDLVFMRSKGENLHTRGLLKESIKTDRSRDCWEISPEAGTFVNQVAERITYNGGFGLFLDYGHDGSRRTPSLRAYHKHEEVNPLSNPGGVDITADVDFGHLKSLVEERVLAYGPVSQRSFLLQLGIEVRLRRLLKVCTSREKQEQLIKSYNFLMGDMGLKFQAMSLFPKTMAGILGQRGGPAGFLVGGAEQRVANNAEKQGGAKESTQAFPPTGINYYTQNRTRMRAMAVRGDYVINYGTMRSRGRQNYLPSVSHGFVDTATAVSFRNRMSGSTVAELPPSSDASTTSDDVVATSADPPVAVEVVEERKQTKCGRLILRPIASVKELRYHSRLCPTCRPRPSYPLTQRFQLIKYKDAVDEMFQLGVNTDASVIRTLHIAKNLVSNHIPSLDVFMLDLLDPNQVGSSLQTMISAAGFIHYVLMDIDENTPDEIWYARMLSADFGSIPDEEELTQLADSLMLPEKWKCINKEVDCSYTVANILRAAGLEAKGLRLILSLDDISEATKP